MNAIAAMDNTICSACTRQKWDAGSLQCGHAFCHECFAKFVTGSLDELFGQIRCCVCGQQTKLTDETKQEPLLFSFGRYQNPRLENPKGVGFRQNGDFVLVDSAQGRVYIYDRQGKGKHDFAYLHDNVCTGGVGITHDDVIMIPLRDKKNSCVSFFSPDGHFLNSAYIHGAGSIQAIATTARNSFVATDRDNNCLHFIDEHRRYQKTVKLLRSGQEEKKDPIPYGISIKENGDIVISDCANDCVRVLDSQGTFKFKFGCRGQRPDEFVSPAGITVDDQDRIFVADKGNHRVQMFTGEGNFLGFVVRYSQGDDVYMTVEDVCAPWRCGLAVLLQGSRDAEVGEVRVYSYSDLSFDYETYRMILYC